MRLLLTAMLSACVWSAPVEDGFKELFNGRDLNGWFVVNRMGPGFLAENGLIVCPTEGGQKLMTEKQYANFVFRFDFRMEPDGNNGIGIRAPREGHTSTKGMEIQILHEGPRYSKERLRPEQLHGSIQLAERIRQVGGDRERPSGGQQVEPRRPCDQCDGLRQHVG